LQNNQHSDSEVSSQYYDFNSVTKFGRHVQTELKRQQ